MIMVDAVRLDGQTVLVTGANTGIGKETALDMARRGARVILACRDENKALLAVEDIRIATGNDNVVVGKLDLASLESIRTFAKHITETEDRLDILINNAGVMGCPHWKTKDGFEMQFGVNHLGHFLLTKGLLEILKSTAPSRIVNVSSIAYKHGNICFEDLNMEKKYSPLKAYCQSKLANILFTRELHRRLEGTGVATFTLHPGAVNTDIGRNLEETSCCLRCLFSCFRVCFKSPASGAKTTIHCAVAQGIEEHSGEYFEDCSVKALSAVALDDDVAERLWAVSEDLVNPIDTEQP